MTCASPFFVFLVVVTICTSVNSWTGIVIVNVENVQVWSPTTGAEDGEHLGLAAPWGSAFGRTADRYVLTSGSIAHLFDPTYNTTVRGAQSVLM